MEIQPGIISFLCRGKLWKTPEVLKYPIDSQGLRKGKSARRIERVGEFLECFDTSCMLASPPIGNVQRQQVQDEEESSGELQDDTGVHEAHNLWGC